jgi:hypothetical protein
MYCAKEKGLNNFQFFGAAMNVAAACSRESGIRFIGLVGSTVKIISMA